LFERRFSQKMPARAVALAEAVDTAWSLAVPLAIVGSTNIVCV
jgi:hypothetical protein